MMLILEGVKFWFGEIQKSEHIPNNATFTATIIPFVCNKGDSDFAYRLSKKALFTRCLVCEADLQTVAVCSVKESKDDEAKKLVQLGKSNKFRHYKLKLPSKNY